MRTGISAQRAPWALLWGALIILGWAVLSSMLGGGTAHAADAPADAPSSLLTKVTGQVKATTTAVSDVVDDVVQPVANEANQAVRTVADTVKNSVERTVAVVPAPVRTPVAEAVTATREVVTTAVEPVVAVIRDAPVARVLKPVTDAVAGLPVVGGVLDSLGVPELIDRTADTVDDVRDVGDPVVSVVLPPVVDAVPPASDDDRPPAGTNPPSSANAVTADAVADRILSELSAARLSVSAAPATATPTERVSAQDASPASDPPGAPENPLSPTTSAGPSGWSAGVPASTHALRRIHVDPWTTMSGPSNSALPSSPAGSTDVSPD